MIECEQTSYFSRSMSSSQLTKEIFEWDIHNWSKSVRVWDPVLKSIQGGQAAAFGERAGGLSLYLAKHGFEVNCSDYDGFNDTPLALHKKHEVEGRISYSAQDITQIDFPDNHFDVVMFKSVIGALNDKGRQQQAIDELYRILKPGGYLLFAENLEATSIHRWARNKFTSWGHRWRYLKWKERHEMFGKFASSKFKTRGFLATFGRTEGQRNFLAIWDTLNHWWIPKKGKYILMGACRK